MLNATTGQEFDLELEGTVLFLQCYRFFFAFSSFTRIEPFCGAPGGVPHLPFTASRSLTRKGKKMFCDHVPQGITALFVPRIPVHLACRARCFSAASEDAECVLLRNKQKTKSPPHWPPFVPRYDECALSGGCPGFRQHRSCSADQKRDWSAAGKKKKM